MKTFKRLWQAWKSLWCYVPDEPELTSEWIELDIKKTCYKNGKSLPHIPMPKP